MNERQVSFKETLDWAKTREIAGGSKEEVERSIIEKVCFTDGSSITYIMTREHYFSEHTYEEAASSFWIES